MEQGAGSTDVPERPAISRAAPTHVDTDALVQFFDCLVVPRELVHP